MRDYDLLVAILYLLRKENECLRSVLSEFEGDKYEYVQMCIADDYRRTINNIERE